MRAGAGFESKVCLILRVPAFSSRRIEQLQESITRIVDGMLDRIEANGPAFDGMKDYGAHLVVDALLDAMVNTRRTNEWGNLCRIRQTVSGSHAQAPRHGHYG